MTHPVQSAAEAAQRLDKWLWFARLCKSRTLAAQMVEDGKVRVNRVRVTKPSQSIRPGDVLTIAQRGIVQVVRILALGARRGPPTEARRLFDMLSSLDPRAAQGTGELYEDSHRRPGKRDRLLIARLLKHD